MKIEGIPEGWQLVRIGKVGTGEWYTSNGKVESGCDSLEYQGYAVIKRIEQKIQPSPGYRLMLADEPVDRSPGSKHQCLDKLGEYPIAWVDVGTGPHTTKQTETFAYQCPIEPQIGPGEGWRLLEPDEPVDRQNASKYQCRNKDGFGAWAPVGRLGGVKQNPDYYYQCPIEPPKTIDVGEGWRLLRDDEPKAEGDQCRLKSKDSWIPVRLDCPKHSPEVMFYRRRIEPPQPTYIPWTDDTCPVGSVVKFAGKNPQVIQEAIAAGCFLGRGGYWSYLELVRNENITHNGKPCGTPGVKTCDH